MQPALTRRVSCFLDYLLKLDAFDAHATQRKSVRHGPSMADLMIHEKLLPTRGCGEAGRRFESSYPDTIY